MAVGLSERPDLLVSKARTPQAHNIEARDAAGIQVRNHIGRHILENPRGAPDHGVGADTAELMHGRLAAENGVIVDAHVAAESNVVREDHVVADMAVMRHMGIRHEEVAASDGGESFILRRTDRHRAVFADHVVVADNEARVFAAVLLVLRVAADARACIDHIALADNGAALNHDVAAKHGAGADLHFGPDKAEGADDDVVGDFSFGSNNGAGMNLCHFYRSSFGAMPQLSQPEIWASLISALPAGCDKSACAEKRTAHFERNPLRACLRDFIRPGAGRF